VHDPTPTEITGCLANLEAKRNL